MLTLQEFIFYLFVYHLTAWYKIWHVEKYYSWYVPPRFGLASAAGTTLLGGGGQEPNRYNCDKEYEPSR